jgi:hypothetical protein
MNRIQRSKAALRTTGWTFTIFYPSAFVLFISLAVTVMSDYSSSHQLLLIVLPVLFAISIFLGLRLSIPRILVHCDLIVEYRQAPTSLSFSVYLRLLWGVWWRSALFIIVYSFLRELFWSPDQVPIFVNILMGISCVFFACFWLYSKQFGKTKIVPRKEVG